MILLWLVLIEYSLSFFFLSFLNKYSKQFQIIHCLVYLSGRYNPNENDIEKIDKMKEALDGCSKKIEYGPLYNNFFPRI